MDKKLFKFGEIGRNGRPQMLTHNSTRRFGGMLRYGSSCYNTDAPSAEQLALLEKVKGTVAEECRAKGYENAEGIGKLITTALEGLNLEALRKYEENKKGLEESIKNLNAEFKKTESKMLAGAAGEKRDRTAPLKALLDANWDKIAFAMQDKTSASVVKLTTRAATIMTMPDAITEPNDMPDDIIESFSVDSFVKKRRPTEFIWQIVNRRTVPEITEYKTWTEEGDEDGAFAIVEEGAVKPLQSKGLVRNFTKYKKVAGKRVYTEEFAKFRKEAYRIIEDLFNDQIMRNYNALVTADLLGKAAGYVGTALDGQYANPTDYHAIGAVAAQIESLDFFPDLLILNPQDKWRIGLSQNEQGTFYMNVPMYNPSGEVQMLGFRVFTSNRVTVGTAILGESNLYKVEDEPVTIRLGYGIEVTKNGGGVVTDVTSDTDTNRFRIIAETWFHSWIATNNLGSFVSFNFNDVKAALTTPGV